MSGPLDEFFELYDALDADERKALAQEAIDATADRVWIPNPGPQTTAVETEADELFYGGQAGGGKSDLVCGLALTEHERTLLLRRQNSDTSALVDRLADILGHRNGLNNAPPKTWRLPGRSIEIGGCQFEKDKQKYKGRPHDLIAFDEIADFTESQYRFIIGWNRSASPGQRSRVVCTGNPPTTPEGLWVLQYWAAWLDDTHPNPAREGELRWYTTIDGKDVEVESGAPVEVAGEMITPRSRTFIRSKLSDNPDLEASGYDATLAALPAELRDAYRAGKFNVIQPDKPQQVIPTSWIKAAQERWREDPPDHTPMTALFHDVALGGGDANAFARRHGYWYDKIVKETLSGHVDPINLAARAVELLRDDAVIGIDMGGGYGSGVYSHLANALPHLVKEKRLIGVNGATASGKFDRSRKLKFKNKRAEVYWLFREALEPGLGIPIQLPPDPELLADLAAVTWKLTPQGIVCAPKEDLRKVLGRSPDKGDCVVNALQIGESPVATGWRVAAAVNSGGQGRYNVKVNTGHSKAKAKLRRGR